MFNLFDNNQRQKRRYRPSSKSDKQSQNEIPKVVPRGRMKKVAASTQTGQQKNTKSLAFNINNPQKTPPSSGPNKRKRSPNRVEFQLGSSDDDTTRSRRVLPDGFYDFVNEALAVQHDPSIEDFQFSLREGYPSSRERLADLEMQLKAMIQQANKDARAISLNSYRSMNEVTVDHILFLCEKLAVNEPTKFRALELYDKFVVRFNDEMSSTMNKMVMSEHETVRARVISQCPLRMCTCIQLAAKLHSDLKNPSFGLEGLKELLNTIGYGFNKEAVIKSEMRVMNTLNFRFHWVTPYDLVEQLISVVKVNETLMPKFYYFAMVFLEWSYICHHSLYRKFQNSLRRTQPCLFGDSNAASEHFKRTIEFNIVLRSATIVNAAALTVLHTAKDPVTRQIASITSTSQTYIEDLSLLLMDLLVQSNS